MSHRKFSFGSRMCEILRFALTGGVSFLVDYGITVLLKSVLGVNYLIASAVGFTVSVFVNYLLCVLWVFDRANRKSRTAIAVFVITSVIGLLLNSLFMYILVDLIGIDYRLAKIAATLLVMIWNYFSKRRAVRL